MTDYGSSGKSGNLGIHFKTLLSGKKGNKVVLGVATLLIVSVFIVIILTGGTKLLGDMQSTLTANETANGTEGVILSNATKLASLTANGFSQIAPVVFAIFIILLFFLSVNVIIKKN